MPVAEQSVCLVKSSSESQCYAAPCNIHTSVVGVYNQIKASGLDAFRVKPTGRECGCWQRSLGLCTFLFSVAVGRAILCSILTRVLHWIGFKVALRNKTELEGLMSVVLLIVAQFIFSLGIYLLHISSLRVLYSIFWSYHPFPQLFLDLPTFVSFLCVCF